MHKVVIENFKVLIDRAFDKVSEFESNMGRSSIATDSLFLNYLLDMIGKEYLNYFHIKEMEHLDQSIKKFSAFENYLEMQGVEDAENNL